MFKCFILGFMLVCFSASGFALTLESEVFKHNDYIPDRYTCDSLNYSPPLKISEVPPKTKSFVLVCDDPDAPFKTWVHWVLVNIPNDYTKFAENISIQDLEKNKVIIGINDFGQIAYGGPCPPKGKLHHYFFRLYALDKMLTVEKGVSKAEVIKKMQGHILAETKLIGQYQRQ